MLSHIAPRLTQLKDSPLFERLVIFVILLAAILVGARSYSLDPRLLWSIGILDMLITVFFVVEISFRWLASHDKKRFFHNFWNLFDFIVVAVSLLPLEHAEVALVARLIRIFRVLRIVSVLPELRMLINSLFKALPQLGYVVLLMFIIFYIYAAVGNMLFARIEPMLWGDISIAMLTLFRIMTFEDWTDVMYQTMAVQPLSWMYYISFIFLTAFAFLNMVIGIVVGVMDDERNKTQNQIEKQTQAAINEELSELRQVLRELNALKQQMRDKNS